MHLGALQDAGCLHRHHARLATQRIAGRTHKLQPGEAEIHQRARRQRIISLLPQKCQRPLVDHRCLYQYRFRHSLFQQYLYDELGEIERRMLHLDVGNVLETLYQEHLEQIVPQLAWHFSEAGETD